MFCQEGSGACQHPNIPSKFVSILTSIGAGKKSQERARSEILKRP